MKEKPVYFCINSQYPLLMKKYCKDFPVFASFLSAEHLCIIMLPTCTSYNSDKGPMYETMNIDHKNYIF